jgi:hypothetical protein
VTVCTVYGIAAAERDLAAYYNRHGRLTGAHSIDELIPDLPDDGITVTVDHDDSLPVGRLVHGELDQDGRLLAVAVVDNWIADYPTAIYWSAELLAVGDGVRTRSRFVADAAALTGLTVTDSPATIAAQPLRILAGDVRDPTARGAWPISWRIEHPVLERCVAQLGTGYDTLQRTATRLLDRRDHDLPGHGWIDPDGRPMRGPLRYGQPGRILSVR